LEDLEQPESKEACWLRALRYGVLIRCKKSNVPSSVLAARFKEMVAAKKANFVLTEEDDKKGFCSVCGKWLQSRRQSSHTRGADGQVDIDEQGRARNRCALEGKRQETVAGPRGKRR
jgi:hypothetical protein